MYQRRTVANENQENNSYVLGVLPKEQEGSLMETLVMNSIAYM